MAKVLRRRASQNGIAPRMVGRPTLATTAAIHERVLQVARGVFLEHGFDGASLELIARDAGVHRDTLYRRYGNKAKLFHVVFWSMMSRMRDGLARSVGRGGPAHVVLPRVARQLYADANSKESIAARRMIVAVSQRFPELAASIHEDYWASDLAPLIQYLEDQRVAGTLQFDDAAEAAYSFATAVNLPLRTILVPPPRGTALEAHLKRVLELYLAGWHSKVWRINDADATGRG